MTSHTPFFDGHNDFLLRLMMSPDPREETWLGSSRKGHLDLQRMKESGFAGGLFAIFVPPVGGGPPPDFKTLTANPPYELPLSPLMADDVAQPFALTMAGLLHWMERTAPNDFKVCRTTSEIRAAGADSKIAGMMHMEGAEAIGPDLDALYLFYDMGLRSLGPVWSRPTIFGHGVPIKFPGTPDIGSGLTEKGKDLVRLCNELGIQIDLSHLNEAGFNDVAAISTAPLVATHSNVYAHCPSPRNLTDRQLAQIRDTGGIAGLNYATFYLHEEGLPTLDDGWDPLLRHMDHLVAHLGEGHVGLGSDFDGCITPDVIGDVTGVPKLFDALAAQGYNKELLTKLAWDNWLSCLDKSL